MKNRQILNEKKLILKYASTLSALGAKLSNFYQFQEITLYMSDSGWTIPVF